MNGDSKLSNEPTAVEQAAGTDASEAISSDSSPLPETVLHDVLSNRRRRYALFCLHECETPITVTELADDVASKENECSSSELSNGEVESVLTSLWHRHIPKLAEANVVECDRDSRTVTLAGCDERLATYLETNVLF